MTARNTQTAPAASDTQTMAIVEVPAARLAYTLDVQAMFRAAIERVIGEEEIRRQQAHEQIDALTDHRIAQFRQAIDDVELNAPLRIGSGPAGAHPYEDAPELSEDPDGALARLEAAHDEQDAAEQGAA